MPEQVTYRDGVFNKHYYNKKVARRTKQNDFTVEGFDNIGMVEETRSAGVIITTQHQAHNPSFLSTHKHTRLEIDEACGEQGPKKLRDL